MWRTFPPSGPSSASTGSTTAAAGDAEKAHRGRHPDQSSDASGAAAAQIGPYATALAVDLRKELGVSERKICRLFAHFGLALTPGGVAQAVARAGRRATPTY